MTEMDTLLDRIMARWARTVEDMSGTRTFVSEKPAKGIQAPSGEGSSHLPGESPRSDQDRALPQPVDSKENLETHTPGTPSYTIPSSSGQTSGKPKVRSPGTPGEEYGHPFKNDIVPRRTAKVPSYSQRQREQRGDARKYYRRYYQRHKGKIRNRAERSYRRNKSRPTFKRQKKLRNDPKYKSKFHRIPAGGYREPAQRSKDYRDKKAHTDPVLWYPPLGEVTVQAVETPWVILQAEDGQYEVDLLDILGTGTFEDQDSMDAFFALVDADLDDANPVVVANFYMEKFTPGTNMDPGDGPRDLGLPGNNPSRPAPDDHAHVPTEAMNQIREVDQGGSSAKVIPQSSGIRPASLRVAARMAEILDGQDPSITQRSTKIRPKLQRSDPTRDIYAFSVPGSGGDVHTVKVKIDRKGNVTDPKKADLLLSCTCEFWRYQGPEHWAKVGGYLYGSPEGSASNPREKDPKGVHRLCKHAQAALTQVQGWSLGGRRR